MRRQELPSPPATPESATPAHNMARSFNGSSAYLEAASAAVVLLPFTMACWFKPANITTAKALVSIGTSGGTDRLSLVENQVSGLGGCFASVNVVGTSESSVAGTVVAGAWQHFSAVFTSSSNRQAYFQGVAGTANTNTITPSGMNRTVIGARINAGSYGGNAAGEIADVGIWSVALAVSEIASLARGARPTSIRPESLVFYNPLDDRWTYDRARGIFLTDVGPTGAAEDPPFLKKPRRKYFIFGSSAVARRKTIMIFP